MDDTIPTQRLKDETFISATAWVIIVFACIILYWSVFYYLHLDLVAKMQGNMFSGMESEEIGAFGAEMQRIQQQMRLGILVSGLGSLMLIVTSMAVIRRRNWGRILMTIASVALIAVQLFFVFYVGGKWYDKMVQMPFGVPLERDGLADDMQKGFRLQFLSYGIFILLTCWALLRVIIKLNKRRIRALFS